MSKIRVLSQEIAVQTIRHADYISLTDIARYKDAQRTDDLIRNWLRNRNTLEFLGIWEQLYNPNFNPVEFDGFKMQAGLKASRSHPSNGSNKLAPSALSPKPVAMGGLSPTKTSLSNLQPG